MLDVLVAGAGPAGRALAAACAGRGLHTALVDPAPERPWRATYAAWAGELPADLPAGVLAATGRGRAVALTEHDLGWVYAVLDTAALHGHLAAAGPAAEAGRVADVRHGPAGSTVRLTDGRELVAAVVVDATGGGPALGGRPRHRVRAEQTAVGVIVPEQLAAPVLEGAGALFMDWRADHGAQGWPTFLYGVPLGGNRVLLEETSLARRPGLGLSELRRRLVARLAARGIHPPADAAEERVRFTLDDRLPRPGRIVPFGAAAPLVHPATGFSVATALRLAPRVAAALERGLRPGGGPVRAAASGWRAVWSPAALAVHVVRRRGLEVLLRMPPAEVPAFFEVFLGLPGPQRWAYLTGREDVAGTASAMAALFRAAPGWLRRRLVLGGAGPGRLTGLRP